MKTIQILGTGCPKCNQLEENAREAVKTAGADCEIVKVSDIKEIMKFGVMITPALAVDGGGQSLGKGAFSRRDRKAFEEGVTCN